MAKRAKEKHKSKAAARAKSARTKSAPVKKARKQQKQKGEQKKAFAQAAKKIVQQKAATQKTLAQKSLPQKSNVSKTDQRTKVQKVQPSKTAQSKGKLSGNSSLIQSIRSSAILNPKKQTESSGPVCREVACELIGTTGGYCRLHYIKNWKKVKRKELILKERKLNRYIEELVAKYPEKYIEALRQDLASEKDFARVISDLEIQEGLDDFDVETDAGEGIIDNIKREVEDDTDIF